MENYELYARTLAKIESLEKELNDAKRHLEMGWNACKQDINKTFRSQMLGVSYSMNNISKISSETDALIKGELDFK